MKSERKFVKVGNGQKKEWEGVRIGQGEREMERKKESIRVEPELRG